MGTRITVGDYSFEAESYSVTENATPLRVGDTTGGTGTIEFVIPQPDPDLPGSQDTGWKALKTFGPEILLDLPLRLADSRKGFTLGSIVGASRADDTGILTISSTSRLAGLNVYGVQAQPFVGTLADAFEYYLSLANIDSDWFVDETIASRPVVFPGWNGELWFYLKQMAAAQDCDVSLVSGVILLRPIRVRVATRGRDLSRSAEFGNGPLAQAVEVYRYDNEAITDELVYPPGGWNPEVEVLNVNAGETVEYTLELSASVSSIDAPVMQTFVASDEDSASVYTIVANDGLPVQPAMWSDYGGNLTVSINPSTTTLKIVLTGAEGIPTVTGGVANNFSVALASDTTGNRYSTLRIIGTGVRYNKTKKRIRTGVPASRTGTEIGVTIDNPFISSLDDLYRAGVRAAKNFTGLVPTLRGVVIAINRLGDGGQASFPTYGEVQDALDGALTAPTYGDVQTFYITTESLTTYESVKTYWFNFVRDDFSNQVFGNINGARIFDRKSRHWYRIRSGTATAENISFEADDDLTNGDIEEFYLGKTYGDVQLLLGSLDYKRAELVGMYD